MSVLLGSSGASVILGSSGGGVVRRVASDTLTHGASYVISGSGFGTKTEPKPLVWADFATDNQPSALGVNTTWTATGLTRVTDAPVHGTAVITATQADPSVNINGTASITNNDTLYSGSTFYLFRRHRKNWAITDASQNWKVLRFYGLGGGQPDLYVGENNGIIAVENPGGLNASYWTSMALLGYSADVWTAEEHIMQGSSANDVKDGSYLLRRDGVQKTTGAMTTMFSHADAINKPFTQLYLVHFVAANSGSWTPQHDGDDVCWATDIYADTTWQRVMLGDASTLAACTELAPQPPSAWADTEITVTVNTRGVSAGTRYLHVIGADNAVISSHAVTV